MGKQRKVTQSMKDSVGSRQRFRCANKPGSKSRGIEDYLCPLWCIETADKGIFDGPGYDIDHIVEHVVSGNDDMSNLQALCKSCHIMKTKAFMRSRTRAKNIDCEQTIEKNSSDDVENAPDKNKSEDIESDDNESDDNESDDVESEDDQADEKPCVTKSNKIELQTRFKCDICDKTFTYKKNLDYHVNNNVCTGKRHVIDEKNNKDSICKYCLKTFTSATNMYRHANHVCKLRKKEIAKRDEICDRLLEVEKNNKILMKKIEKCEKENTILKKKLKN